MSSYQNPPEDPFATNTGHSAPPMKEDLPNAQSSMIMGIISLVSVVVLCGSGVVGLILGIIAMVQAKKNEEMIAAEPDRWTESSKSNLKTGKITGLIGVIVNGLGVIFWIIYFIAIAAVVASAPSGLDYY